MRCRKLDNNGDYSFGTNSEDYIGGSEAVAQAIKTKILLFYGEWWENIGVGIPMFQSIIGQMNPESLKMSATMLVTQRIKEIPEVKSIDDINITVNGRDLYVTVTVTTDEGQTTVEVNI